MSNLVDQRAEWVLLKAKELIQARLRPNEGWHNHWKHEAEMQFSLALRDYVAAKLAAGTDSYVWRELIDEAKQLLEDEAKEEKRRLRRANKN